MFLACARATTSWHFVDIDWSNEAKAWLKGVRNCMPLFVIMTSHRQKSAIRTRVTSLVRKSIIAKGP